MNKIKIDNIVVQWGDYYEHKRKHDRHRVCIIYPFTFGKKNSNIDNCCVHIDENGNEYFYLRDVGTLQKTKNVLDAFFYDTPADAISYVQKGYADALVQRGGIFNSVFSHNCHLSPIVYINRNVGQLMRYKTLQGFPEKVEYKWALVKTSKNSFSSNDCYLRKNYQDSEIQHDDDKFIFFLEDDFNKDSILLADTEEEITKIIPEIQYDTDDYCYKARQYILS